MHYKAHTFTRYSVKGRKRLSLRFGASRGEREHLTPEARGAVVWPHLWFRFPKLLTPSSHCTCRAPVDPLPGPFHHKEYMTPLPGSVWLITPGLELASNTTTGLWRSAAVATQRPHRASPASLWCPSIPQQGPDKADRAQAFTSRVTGCPIQPGD